MEKWILVVRSNCANLVEGYELEPHEKFNEWYDNFHVPDVLKTPGFVSARRFVNPDISTRESGKYLAIYEIETEDIGKTLRALFENMREVERQGRFSKLVELVSMTAYKQITDETKAK